MNDARDIIDRTVLVKLESYEGIEFTGIESEGPFFCKVKAVDEVGIWVKTGMSCSMWNTSTSLLLPTCVLLG